MCLALNFLVTHSSGLFQLFNSFLHEKHSFLLGCVHLYLLCTYSSFITYTNGGISIQMKLTFVHSSVWAETTAHSCELMFPVFLDNQGHYHMWCCSLEITGSSSNWSPVLSPGWKMRAAVTLTIRHARGVRIGSGGFIWCLFLYSGSAQRQLDNALIIQYPVLQVNFILYFSGQREASSICPGLIGSMKAQAERKRPQ